MSSVILQTKQNYEEHLERNEETDGCISPDFSYQNRFLISKQITLPQSAGQLKV